MRRKLRLSLHATFPVLFCTLTTFHPGTRPPQTPLEHRDVGRSPFFFLRFNFRNNMSSLKLLGIVLIPILGLFTQIILPRATLLGVRQGDVTSLNNQKCVSVPGEL